MFFVTVDGIGAFLGMAVLACLYHCRRKYQSWTDVSILTISKNNLKCIYRSLIKPHMTADL